MNKVGCFFILAMSWLSYAARAQYAIAAVRGGVYVDIVPDTLISAPGGNNTVSYYLDMNQDAVSDIEVQSYYGYSPGQNWNGLKLISHDPNITFSNTKAFYSGDTIQTSSTSYVASGSLYTWSSLGGQSNLPWGGNTDQYIGVKYSGSGISFGWIRVNVSSWSATIKEYSLGDPLVGISGFMPALSIYPNPVREILTVKSNTPLGVIEILNVVGDLVYAKKSQVTEEHLDLSEISNGIYFISIGTAGAFFKRIVINH